MADLLPGTTWTFEVQLGAPYGPDVVLLATMQFVKMTDRPYTRSWFEEHLPWPAQSPDGNNIEPLWSVLESRMRIRVPPPSSLKKLEDVLREEWHSVPMETVQDLCKSVHRSIQGVLQANGGPTLY